MIDLTAMWAGPMVTNTLVQLGADVIKVESIQRPDGMRMMGTVPGDRFYEWGPIFHGVNPGKRDITLDLNSERGIDLLRKLIEGADVVAENFSTRVMTNFGLTWERLRKWNPRLLLLRMPAFGLDGPWKDRPGWASNVDQVSGLAWRTGYDESFPIIVRAACDPIGGLHGAFALMLGLEARRRTGRGQLIEVPLVEPALAMASESVIEYTAYGAVLGCEGNRGPYAAPQGIYPTAEGEPLALAIATDAQWQALCGVLDATDWADDPDLSTAAGRRAAHDAIDERVSRWSAELGCGEAVDQLIAAGIPCSPVANAHEVDAQPQLAHRHFLQTLVHPETGAVEYPVLPMQFSSFGPALFESPPPTLGQHNEEVLMGELGLSTDEFAQLEADQVIGTKPSFL